MNEFVNIKLDKKSNVPIYQQIGDAFASLIQNGVLAPNAKLPPIRKIADALRVNNITAINAYKYLENKRLVYSLVGSGTYVSQIAAGELPEPVASLNRSYAFAYRGKETAVNFANSSTSPDLFPVEDFKFFFNEVLDRDGGGAFSYQDSQGYEPLRESLSGYLDQYGIKAAADRIQIISGAQQGIDLIAKATLKYGDYVFVEKPTYYGAVGAFLSRGARVLEMPLLSDGPDMDKLEALLRVYKPRLIYVMPYFQTPTCINYSMEKKRKLLELAVRYDAYILEEDNQSEFYFKDAAITPLKALDYKNRVIYIKGFSKILMPGLRLGFMALPKAVLELTLQSKYTTDISTSGFFQRAFDLYLRSGKWESRKAFIRGIFFARYQTMLKAASEYLTGEVSYREPEGGLNIWLEINGIGIDALMEELTKRGVIVTPGAVFGFSDAYMPFIRLSYASVDCGDIEKGVRLIGEAVRNFSEWGVRE